ncbi:MAG: hypothetical protein HY273_02250 [Gammaproteobacteria bacterium]|nr:hypothetical protein [Gammaproteobacteria bacterium]
MINGGEFESSFHENISSVHPVGREGGGSMLVACGFIAATATVLSQIYLWLRSGEWIPMPLSALAEWMGIEYPNMIHSVWPSAQKILAWFFDFPLSLTFIVLGVAAGFLAWYGRVRRGRRLNNTRPALMNRITAVRCEGHDHHAVPRVFANNKPAP